MSISPPSTDSKDITLVVVPGGSRISSPASPTSTKSARGASFGKRHQILGRAKATTIERAYKTHRHLSTVTVVVAAIAVFICVAVYGVWTIFQSKLSDTLDKHQTVLGVMKNLEQFQQCPKYIYNAMYVITISNDTLYGCMKQGCPDDPNSIWTFGIVISQGILPVCHNLDDLMSSPKFYNELPERVQTLNDTWQLFKKVSNDIAGSCFDLVQFTGQTPETCATTGRKLFNDGEGGIPYSELYKNLKDNYNAIEQYWQKKSTDMASDMDDQTTGTRACALKTSEFFSLSVALIP